MRLCSASVKESLLGKRIGFDNLSVNAVTLIQLFREKPHERRLHQASSALHCCYVNCRHCTCPFYRCTSSGGEIAINVSIYLNLFLNHYFCDLPVLLNSGDNRAGGGSRRRLGHKNVEGGSFVNFIF